MALPDSFQDRFEFCFIIANGHVDASYYIAFGTIKHGFDTKDKLSSAAGLTTAILAWLCMIDENANQWLKICLCENMAPCIDNIN
eukprot:3204474-Ditylum_brightwellii.AAC.1